MFYVCDVINQSIYIIQSISLITDKVKTTSHT